MSCLVPVSRGDVVYYLTIWSAKPPGKPGGFVLENRGMEIISIHVCMEVENFAKAMEFYGPLFAST